MASATNASFWKSGHRGALFAAFLYTEVSFMIWIAMGAVALFAAEAMHLDPAATGILVALPILSGTLLKLPAGMLVDRLGPRRVGLAVHILLLVVLAWLWARRGATGGDLYMMAAALGIAGVSFSVAMPMVSGWYPPEHQGKALGLTALGGAGTLLTAALGPRLAEAHGWQAVFGFAALPVALSLAVYLFLAEDPGERPPPRPVADYLLVLRYADSLWFCFFYAVTFGGFVSLASSLVVYFHDHFALSPAAAGGLTALCILSGTLFRPLGGWLADRLGGIRSMKLAFAAIAIALGLLTLAPEGLVRPSLMLLLVAMAGLGLGNGATFQLIPLRFFRQMGVMTGLVGTAGGLGGFFLAWGSGLLREATGGYRAGFLLYALLSLIALAGLWSVKQRWRTTWGAPHATTAKV